MILIRMIGAFCRVGKKRRKLRGHSLVQAFKPDSEPSHLVQVEHDHPHAAGEMRSMMQTGPFNVVVISYWCVALLSSELSTYDDADASRVTRSRS